MSLLKTLFGFDVSKHSVKTEIIAGITTFLTMAYILMVNPSMFAEIGHILGEEYGMPVDAVFTATALAAIVGTLMMAIYAKKPFGLAPGMGLNVFFVYGVCIGMGYSWQFALTAILIEGIIFIIISATNVREYIVNAFPLGLKQAIGVGIGLYIAFIGLQNSGIVVRDATTLVTLGKFNNRDFGHHRIIHHMYFRCEKGERRNVVRHSDYNPYRYPYGNHSHRRIC